MEDSEVFFCYNGVSMPRRKKQRIVYSDNFQRKYQYELTEPVGKNFDPLFTPELTPKEMLKKGVFGGAYFVGVDGLVPNDLPTSWFNGVKLSDSGKKDRQYNYFDTSASQKLSVWQVKGWIAPQDPHGWFQWYCRYYMGRRLPEEDKRQIGRWRAFKRHKTQVEKNCRKKDLSCRRRQRQALLHWAYDGTKI